MSSKSGHKGDSGHGKKIPEPEESGALESGASAAMSQEDIVRVCARIAHMFEPHAGNPLMERLSEAVLRLAGEGRIRD